MKTILLSTAFLLYTVICYSQFGNALEIGNNGLEYYSIHPMDLDNDGDIDVLSTDGATGSNLGSFYNNYFAGTVAAQKFMLNENVGTNAFVNHTLFDLGAPMFWTFGDLSGDGLMDFVYADQYAEGATSYRIYYKENVGSFSFGPDQLVYELQAYDPVEIWDFWFNRVAIGDVNSDGDNEIAALYNGTPGDFESYSTWNNIYMIDYESGIFATPVLLSMSLISYGACGCPSEVSDLIIEDFNSDGWNDVIFQRFVGDGNEMMVHQAIGAGLFDNESTMYLYSYSWDMADMQGDGQNNLVGIDPLVGYMEVSDPDFLWTVSPTFNLIDNLAPGLAALDMDADNDCDVIVPTITGELVIFEQDELWNSAATNLVLNYSMFDPGIPFDVTSMSRMDYDNDGDQDLLLIADGHVYVVAIDNDIDNFAGLHINGYLDDNGNGIWDSGENAFNNFNAEITATDVGIVSYYTSLGEINANLVPDNYLVNVIDNFGAYNLGVTMPVTISLADVTTDVIIDVPFVVDGTPTSGASAYLFSWSGVCNATSVNHVIVVTNTEGLVADGIVTYTLDPVHSFISSDPAPTSISGNTISWDFSGLAPNNGLSFTVNVSAAPLASLGSEVTNVVNVQLLDVNGDVSFDINEYNHYIVSCSYDPNQITENLGYTDEGYVLDGGLLEYTIQFQNLGNAPATNVRIENQLSDLLQRNTLQPIASSHDYDLVIDENDKAIFSFNNINLPDATNNEAESHGFITYRILPITGLAAGTVINNVAGIYFDLNPAIITNTELNTIYDCADLQQASVSEISVCSGEEITCNNNAVWIENLNWSFNGNSVGTGNYTHTISANGTLTMQVSNALCEYTQEFQLTANTANASFTSNGNTLTANDAASYQWFLNGIEIAGATQQTYEITETGNYSVMVEDANGCDGVSDAEVISYTGISIINSNLCKVFPNPTSEMVSVNVGSQYFGSEVCIVDLNGSIVRNFGILKTMNNSYDLSGLDAGVYFVMIGNQANKLLVK
jgi:hypothetical protein